VSCDQVFAGSGEDPKFRFNEDDDANPLNELASSKTRGESLVINHNRLTYVFRLARPYGERLGSPQRPRDSWIQRIIDGPAAEVPALLEDQRRSSVYVGDVVRAMRLFLKNPPLSSTLFHLSAGDALSEAEAAHKVIEAWHLDAEKFGKRSVQEAVAEQGFNIPKFSAMSAKRFENTYKFQFQSFPEGLKELRDRLEAGYSQGWT
jgi:dTDP-4-dehydrorhamnose reductase